MSVTGDVFDAAQESAFKNYLSARRAGGCMAR
jgi:hypothetical protein